MAKTQAQLEATIRKLPRQPDSSEPGTRFLLDMIEWTATITGGEAFDGTSMPTRIEWSTSPDGSRTPQLAMAINSDQDVVMENTARVDTIVEKTSDTGVTIEGVQLKDGVVVGVPQMVGMGQYEPNGFPDNSEVDLSWDDATRTMTISPSGASFTVFSNGNKFVKTSSEQLQIGDVAGEHWIYYDSAGVLQEVSSFQDPLVFEHALVAFVHWDATSNNAVPDAIDELHTSLMAPIEHKRDHLTKGTLFEQGLGMSMTSGGSGDDAVDLQFSAAEGYIWDEDNRHHILAKALTDGFYMVYQYGAGGLWRRGAKSNLLGLTAGSGRQAWNEWTGSAWQLTEVTNGDFVLAHIFAIPGFTEQWVGVVGQGEYGTQGEARDAATTEITTIDLSGWPWSEGVLIGSIIIQTNTSYANAKKGRIFTTDEGTSHIDWRDVIISAGAPAVAHSQLPGLQGGTTGEYYHLTAAQHTELAALAALLGSATQGQTLVRGVSEWELTGP